MSGYIQSVISLAVSFVSALRLMAKMHCGHTKTLWSHRDLLVIRNRVEGCAPSQGRGLFLGLWHEPLARALDSHEWSRPSYSSYDQSLVGVSLPMVSSLCSSISAGGVSKHAGPTK